MLSESNLIALGLFCVFCFFIAFLGSIVHKREAQEIRLLGIAYCEKKGPSFMVWSITAFLVGLLAASFGVAGGLFLLPVMLHYDLNAQASIITSNYILLFVAASATMQFIQMGFFNFEYFLLFATFMLLANIVSIYYMNAYL